MGSTYSKGYDLTPHFSLEFHPVEGEVHLFRLKGYSLFLFSNSNNSPLFTQKAQQIQQQSSDHLCTYHGNLFAKESISFEESWLCCGEKGINQIHFWTFHNFSLVDEVQYKQIQDKAAKEQQLWSTIKTLLEAAQVLIKHQVYLDFNLHNILVSPNKKKQLYWGNFSEDNSHRNFYKINGSKSLIQREGLSPEQTKSLLKKLTKFDLQKCVVHSLGRVVLLYSTNHNHFGQIIDFNSLCLKNRQISCLLKDIQNRYSKDMLSILTNMLSEKAEDRMNFRQLRQFLQSEQYLDLKIRLDRRLKKHESTSPTSISSHSLREFNISEF